VTTEPWHAAIAALLRARRDRPCRRSAEQRDELTAPHSITSSAMLSSPDERVRLSALAVFILITNSNLVGERGSGLGSC
jgi:hypothetical protein